MLATIGIVSIGVLIIALAVISFIFLWLSENTAYNPCSFNVYKDDYKQFAITGMFHSVGVAIFAVLQLLSELFPDYVACHLNGSVQVLSLIPTLLYYHVLVINYKYRYLEVRHRGHSDYHKTYFLEMLSLCAYVFIATYSVILFQAETAFPHGIFSPPVIDPISGWDMDNYASLLNFLIAIGTCLLLMDFFRVARNSYRIYHVYNEPEETNQYYFRKYISKNVEPHFVNDLITLYVPAQYLLLRSYPVMTMNGIDILAKCVLIAHPIVFLIIYMLQIKLATRKANKDEMECRCCVCRKKSQSRRASRTDSRFISLKVMGSGTRNDNGVEEEEEGEEGEEERGGGAATMTNAHEQPTETTSAMYTTQIRVSEDN